MEILRIPSYSSIVSIQVSEPNTEYSYQIQDMADFSISEGTGTSNSDSTILIELPYNYDGTYEVTVDGESYIYDIVRPYVDASTKGSTASEIAEYAKNEELARAVIDSVIRQGFYYKKKVIQATGLGNDYLPIWTTATKVLKVYENNVLIFDSSEPDNYIRHFEITPDKTAIIQKSNETFNRLEGASILIPAAATDTNDFIYFTRTFARTADYVIVVEDGYKRLPSDIVKAAELLIEDISCGKIEYYKRYVADYNTDQFKIKFDSGAFEGTGNLVVDKILSKYLKSIQTLGVL